MTLETMLAHHIDEGGGAFCSCQPIDDETGEREHLPGSWEQHLADRIREWLLNDQTIEAAAEILFAHDFGNYSPDAHPDHNRWTWRGDGHTEEFKDGYRNVTRQALTAALDQGK